MVNGSWREGTNETKIGLKLIIVNEAGRQAPVPFSRFSIYLKFSYNFFSFKKLLCLQILPPHSSGVVNCFLEARSLLAMSSAFSFCLSS